MIGHKRPFIIEVEFKRLQVDRYHYELAVKKLSTFTHMFKNRVEGWLGVEGSGGNLSEELKPIVSVRPPVSTFCLNAPSRASWLARNVRERVHGHASLPSQGKIPRMSFHNVLADELVAQRLDRLLK